MFSCNECIRNGIVLRYIITLVSFYILFIYYNNKFIHNYFYLILSILLILLDLLDSTYIDGIVAFFFS